MTYPIHHKAGISFISDDSLIAILDNYIEQRLNKAKTILLLPPDLTRLHSKAGFITHYLYQKLHRTAKISIMPALGTHDPMSDDELTIMFGSDIPKSCFLPHHWRDDIVDVGRIPSERMLELSEGKLDCTMDIAVNKIIVEHKWDAIVSIGQIVPHEVIGMANYTKNVLVGIGGADTIHKSHYLGAVYGMERIMGRTYSPVRLALNEGMQAFLGDLPLDYVLTVIGNHEGKPSLKGLYIGNQIDTYEEACEHSRAENLTLLDEPITKAVVYLDPQEFKTTWLGNKAIYRLRMAMADGGDLIVLAPGLKRFGEDLSIDSLIRQYGYRTTDETLEAVENDASLKNNLSAAAHLIHGTTNGRFNVTYCPSDNVSRDEIEQVNYLYCHYNDMIRRYDPNKLNDGWNIVDNEKIFFVSNPALGLWATKNRFETA